MRSGPSLVAALDAHRQVQVVDWRDAAPELLSPLYERARARWAGELGWDTAGNWRQIEQARTMWGLPGLLAVDGNGHVQGWTYFLPQGDLLQVGGITADTPQATEALIDGVTAACDALQARAVTCFMFDEAPNLASALADRVFEVEPFLYLTRAVTRDRAARGGGRADRRSVARGFRVAAGAPGESDVAPIADLLRASYGADAARYFAPGHTPAAWEHYVRTLINQTGLGAFNAGATRIVEQNGRIGGAVLVTALSSETVHLAQVAVHPSARGRGLAEALVTDVISHAAALGFASVTLLVGGSNGPAQRLYERLGFTPRSRFIAAHRSA